MPFSSFRPAREARAFPSTPKRAFFSLNCVMHVYRTNNEHWSRIAVRLVNYPFVTVRLQCDVCKRSGQSKLARLAAKYGCEIAMDVLLERITRDCPWRRDGAFDRSGCGIYCCDLPQRVPPDLPPSMVRLRAVR